MKETLTLTISKVFYHNYNTILSIHLEKNVEITLRYILH